MHPQPIETEQVSLPVNVRVVEQANNLQVFECIAPDGTRYRIAQLGGNISRMEIPESGVSIYREHMAATKPFNPAVHHPGGNAPKGVMNQTEGTQGPHGDASQSIIHGPEQAVRWEVRFITNERNEAVGIEMICPDLSIEPLDRAHPERGLRFPELAGRPVQTRQFIAFIDGGYFQSFVHSHMAAHPDEGQRTLTSGEQKNVIKGPGFHSYYEGSPDRSMIQFGRNGEVIPGHTIYPRSNVEQVFTLPEDGTVILRRSTIAGNLQTTVIYSGDYHGTGELRTWSGNTARYYCVELEPIIPESFTDEDTAFILDRMTEEELSLLRTKLDTNEPVSSRTFRKLLGTPQDTLFSSGQRQEQQAFAARIRQALQRILKETSEGSELWRRLSESPYSGSPRWQIALTHAPETPEAYQVRLLAAVASDQTLDESTRNRYREAVQAATIYDPLEELRSRDDIHPQVREQMERYYTQHTERHLRLPLDIIPELRERYANWQQTRGSFIIHAQVTSRLTRRSQTR